MKKQRIQELFKQLQHEWGINDFELDFFNDKVKDNVFGANSGVLGYCNCYTKVIGLWEPYVKINKEERVLETLKHEVAHALRGPEYEHGGHDELWRDMCKLVGAIPDPISCSKTLITPIPVFGTYWFSWLTDPIDRFLFRSQCNCFKCTYGVERY